MGRQNDRGMALIAVLAFLAVMSLLAISVVDATRGSIQGASRRLLRAQADAAIDSGVNAAIAELVGGGLLPPPILRDPKQIEIGGFAVTLSARRESAKIDLNVADAELLMGMFRAVGVDLDRAKALASAVQDWRDDDDLLHVSGAEKNDYSAAGLGYGPANKLFESVDELNFVKGVTPAMYACLKPEITVFSQRAEVDLDAASPLVRRAAGGNEDGPSPRGAGQGVIAGESVSPGDAFEIVAKLDDGARKIRRAQRVVVRVTGNPREPFWVLSVEPLQPMLDAAHRNCPAAMAEYPP